MSTVRTLAGVVCEVREMRTMGYSVPRDVEKEVKVLLSRAFVGGSAAGLLHTRARVPAFGTSITTLNNLIVLAARIEPRR